MLSMVKPLLGFTPNARENFSSSDDVTARTPIAAGTSTNQQEEEPEFHPRYWALVLVVIPMATILGNLLVMVSVARVRSLQTNVNFLVFALASADFMVACAVMPYAVYTEVLHLYYYRRRVS